MTDTNHPFHDRPTDPEGAPRRQSASPTITDAEFEVVVVDDAEPNPPGGGGTGALVPVPSPTGAMDVWVEPQPIRRTDHDIILGWLATQKSDRTRRAYRDDIEAFLEWVGRPLAAITDAMIQRHVLTMTAKDGSPVSDRTRERRLTAIRSLFKYAVGKRHLAINEAATAKLPTPEDTLAERILTKRAVRALVAAAKPGRDRGLLALLYIAGLRVSEVSGLCYRHLALSENPTAERAAVLTVYGKGARTRHVALPESIVHDLEHLRRRTAALNPALVEADQPIFRSRKTVGRNAGHLHPSSIHRLIKAALESARQQAVAAGNERLLADLKAGTSAHWFRHAHASHALEAGADLALVRDTLGHASVATTNRYLATNTKKSSARYVSVTLDDL
ncbi:tyrosine-type recombinase/integrase [Azospirillum soli]|uniref:tyrosine-type recombinase/integrase n=1 Tax=Azospirillum soli TaxID=1304799 RepID=UPI001AEABE5F|nr:tyrosine-type recombinase/integrase [Azospirillum soli]MBP2315509.1 integrase/recombinase XerD [Azospirillum soli]